MSEERMPGGAERARPAGGLDLETAHAPQGASCGGTAVPELDRSRVLRHDGAGWDAVRELPYRDGGSADVASFHGITRRVLASPEAAAFEVRYFELDPGGHSSLERHTHVHVVVCFRGRGRVRLGEEVHEVGYGDVVYVAPDEPHQFLNPYGEPFGFLCIVDRERDRPVPIGG